jgi:tripartite-type tricarboxylate transporter receptor subunit TctC
MVVGALGQQFLVENRAGAGGSLATEAVVNALSDGHTLLLAGANDSWNSSLYDRLSFNFIRDIRPVASISRGVGVLVVSPSFSAKTVPELLALAKANPGNIAVASSGVGSAPHVFWELFKSMTGVDMLHVPYRGGGPALTDLLGGQVQVMFPSLAPSIEYIRTGKLRPLAITAATRFVRKVKLIGECNRGTLPRAGTWPDLRRRAKCRTTPACTDCHPDPQGECFQCNSG